MCVCVHEHNLLMCSLCKYLLYICTYIYIYIYIYMSVCVCVNIIYLCVYLCNYLHYICVCVCVCVYIYIYIYIYIKSNWIIKKLISDLCQFKYVYSNLPQLAVCNKWSVFKQSTSDLTSVFLLLGFYPTKVKGASLPDYLSRVVGKCVSMLFPKCAEKNKQPHPGFELRSPM